MSDDAVRSGLPGIWDRVVGPGTTRAENLGTLTFAGLSAVAVGLDTALRLEVGGLAWVAATAIAFDIGAGVWVLATPAARRWYHGSGRGLRHGLAFSAGHVHPFVIAALFSGATWPWAGFVYGSILAATLLVYAMPRPLRAATALATCPAIIAIASVLAPEAPVWFAPTLALKLVGAHTVPDVPGS